jgi:UDP-N-acetylmuramoyl-L-alanyl-D-glutamate--2,6-diaminopimelate ligase
MTLKHLIAATSVLPAEMCGDAEVSGVEIDSRKVKPGALFVCMPETTRPSEAFIPAAAEQGAKSAIVYSREGMQLAVSYGLACALVPHHGELFSDAVWKLCDAYFEHPTRDLTLIGITGTNGKTTTAWLIRDLLERLGPKAAYLGTLGFHLPDRSRELENTTPFAVDLYNLIAEARKAGADAISMEVSSHALAQHRVGGLEFDVAVLTNLTQDHLDFHGTMEAYAHSKHRLFVDQNRGSSKRLVSAFNIDDPVGKAWAVEQNGPTVTYALQDPEADLKGEPIEIGVDHIRMTLSYRGEAEAIIPLGGAYNVQNTLSAVAATLGMGYRLADIAEALATVRPVPGRFEPVKNSCGISILVDYAHTPDALEKLLDSVREVSGAGKIITVFGCGGDRDKTKRPKMAKSASSRSDLTVATSDNPRTEDPNQILRDVVAGIVPGRDSIAILDRREAVAHAVKSARPGDVVVIAGKGHENYQIIGRTKHPMDDRELALSALGEPS